MDFRFFKRNKPISATISAQTQRENQNTHRNAPLRASNSINIPMKVPDRTIYLESDVLSAIKNSNSVRAPRKSMLGKHRVSRESILPLFNDINFTSVQNQRDELEVSDRKTISLHVPSIRDDLPQIPDHREIDNASPSSDSSFISCAGNSPPENHLSFKNTIDNSFDDVHQCSSKNNGKTSFHLSVSNSESDITLTNSHDKSNNPVFLESSIIAKSEVRNKEKTLLSMVPKLETIEKEKNNNKNCSKDIEQVIHLMDTLMERNSQSVLQYQNEIKDLQTKLDETNQEIMDLKKLREMLENEFQCKKIDTEDNQLTEEQTTSPSKQFVRDLRSSIDFLKTPRKPKASRSSMLLTPHSMSFCIQSQFDKLNKL